MKQESRMIHIQMSRFTPKVVTVAKMLLVIKAFGIIGIGGFGKRSRSPEEFPLSAVEFLTTGDIFEGETESL